MPEYDGDKSGLLPWVVNVSLIALGTVFIVWLGTHSWSEQQRLITLYGQGFATIIECMVIVLFALPSRRVIRWWMENKSVRRLLIMIGSLAIFMIAIVYMTTLTSWIVTTIANGMKNYMHLLQSAG